MDVPETAREIVRKPLGAASDAAFQAKVLHDVGILRPSGPRQVARTLHTLARWGTSPAAVTSWPRSATPTRSRSATRSAS